MTKKSVSHASDSQLRFNHWVVVLLFILLAVLVNYVSFKQYYRKDFTAAQFSSLSTQSKQLVSTLKIKEPIKITAFVNAQSGDDAVTLIGEDVNHLLESYKQASGGKVEFEKLDPVIDEKAKLIAEKFKLNISECCVIIERGDRSKIIRYSEMADIDGGMSMMGQSPQVREFKAEAKISEAIRALVSEKKAKIYYTDKHGEFKIDAAETDTLSISLLAARIRNQNADLVELNLLETPKVPDDADMLLIIGPKIHFLPDQIQTIQEYLQRNGRLLLMLSPMRDTGLENLLDGYGVTFNNDLIIRAKMLLTDSGVIQRHQAMGVQFSTHPAIRWANNAESFLVFGTTRSLKVQPPAPAEGKQTPEVAKLVQTSDKDWGETNLQVGPDGVLHPSFNEKEDNKGPLTIAAAIDTGAVKGGQVNLKGTRIVAVGSSDFLTNQNLTSSSVDFVVNNINWILGEEESLGITPKTPKNFVLNLTDDQIKSITGFLLLVPILLGLVGLGVWISRRK